MIGEGTKSTNQRRHTYVRDNVEVGFFTDPFTIPPKHLCAALTRFS
jgi:hypothetical protein